MTHNLPGDHSPPGELTLEEVRRESIGYDPKEGKPLRLCDNPEVTFLLSKITLTVQGDPDINDWTEAFETLRRQGESLMWAVGDLAVFGMDTYGDAARRVIDAAGYADESIRKMERVCRRFPIGMRIPTLSFTHHSICEGLDEHEAQSYLRRAARSGMSTRQLAELIRPKPAGEPASDPLLPVIRPASKLEKALAKLDGEQRAVLVERAAAAGYPFDGDRWPAGEAVLAVLTGPAVAE